MIYVNSMNTAGQTFSNTADCSITGLLDILLFSRLLNAGDDLLDLVLVGFFVAAEAREGHGEKKQLR
jgi:hypothetical protein